MRESCEQARRIDPAISERGNGLCATDRTTARPTRQAWIRSNPPEPQQTTSVSLALSLSPRSSTSVRSQRNDRQDKTQRPPEGEGRLQIKVRRLSHAPPPPPSPSPSPLLDMDMEMELGLGLGATVRFASTKQSKHARTVRLDTWPSGRVTDHEDGTLADRAGAGGGPQVA